MEEGNVNRVDSLMVNQLGYDSSNKGTGNSMRWLRWVAVIPSSIFAWYTMFVFGMFALFCVRDHFYPPEGLISGQCMVWWYIYVEQTVIYLFVALSAFFVVICAAIIAPLHRMYVAWIAYLLGFLVAVYFLSQTSAIDEFMSAIFAGLLGVFSVAKLLGSPVLPNKSFQPTCWITARG